MTNVLYSAAFVYKFFKESSWFSDFNIVISVQDSTLLARTTNKKTRKCFLLLIFLDYHNIIYLSSARFLFMIVSILT